MLHVGTNNIEFTESETVEGILEIVQTIRQKHPNVYIIVPVSSILFIFFSTRKLWFNIVHKKPILVW